MDLDDFLKKAMEEEMRADDISEEEKQKKINAGKAFGSMMSVLALGKMVGLSKAAVNKKSELIEDLTTYLSSQNKSDKPSWHAHCSNKIESTAKKIRILDTLISATVMSGVAENDEDYNNIIDSILAINMMH